MINFFDISKQDLKYKNKILKKISKIIDANDFINGKEIEKFEKKFARLCSARYCVTVGNGTDALIIALKSLNLKKNDEVIIPSMTWKSTLLAPLNLNIKTKLVDLEKNSSNIDLNDLKKKLLKERKLLLVYIFMEILLNIKKLKK